MKQTIFRRDKKKSAIIDIYWTINCHKANSNIADSSEQLRQERNKET